MTVFIGLQFADGLRETSPMLPLKLNNELTMYT